MQKKLLIVAALSARGYAQAAVACGYEVVAIDAFADADTQRMTKQAFKVKLQAETIDTAEFKRVFSEINITHCIGFIYGSLFDGAHELLDWVAERLAILGNPAKVMRLAKSAAFFDLLRTNAIAYPPIQLKQKQQDGLFKSSEQWLSKKFGSTGGMHVKPLVQHDESAEYFQRKVAGLPVSLLFLSDGISAKTVGYNLQLLAPTEELPYRFAGAVSHYDLPISAKNTLDRATQTLTEKLRLRGCNSLDAIFDGHEVWVLELNPRLSASFQLYPNLMQAHLQGCYGDSLDIPTCTKSRAQFILYADRALEIPTEFDWPEGMTDIPAVNKGDKVVSINNNAPICTVNAEAETAEQALKLVLEKTEILKNKLFLNSH
ncbi:MAG: ATP-grasp domain-containing protein [Methylophilaceae bacterium]